MSSANTRMYKLLLKFSAEIISLNMTISESNDCEVLGVILTDPTHFNQLCAKVKETGFENGLSLRSLLRYHMCHAVPECINVHPGHSWYIWQALRTCLTQACPTSESNSNRPEQRYWAITLQVDLFHLTQACSISEGSSNRLEQPTLLGDNFASRPFPPHTSLPHLRK